MIYNEGTDTRAMNDTTGTRVFLLYIFCKTNVILNLKSLFSFN
jgi:hypothetical protein